MSKFLVTGIVQVETIVRVDRLPIVYSPVTNREGTVFTNIGGDAYNESLALKWLGNSVDLLTMVGRSEGKGLINPPDTEVKLETDYVLPVLRATPHSVIFCDNSRKHQIFEDMKGMGSVRYDEGLFRERAQRANTILVSNDEFCRPLVGIGRGLNKRIAVNIRDNGEGKAQRNEDFMAAADILYVSDDNLEEEPFDYVKGLAAAYRPSIIILGQGDKGLILYDKKENIIAHYNTVKTNEIVNTAGAGNALFSCFLHFYEKTGDSVFSVKNALLFASYKIGFVGTSNGFMTEAQISQWRNLIWRDGR